ncbi:MAG: carboxylating nicotinate-nucleotide diphosphorylase [Prevotella sp.]|nr:carboxylating nicotinate-nucleotide diphosphorylase [Prevotella sp.]
MKTNNDFFMQYVDRLIDLAFDEDLFAGDVATEAILPVNHLATAVLTAKADGVVSGIEIARRVADRMGENTFEALLKDGDEVVKGQTIATIHAPYNQLLSSERIMLNFLQRMSGIATMTRRLVKLVARTHATLLDTRKTVPGHRMTDKMAVRHGGGSNHRMGLYDMAMLKDNHIKAAGGITPAVAALRSKCSLATKIEVETTNLSEVKEALQAGADIIMLDNMSLEMMRQAVEIIGGKAKTEASGNINEDTIAGVAATGVDFISVGALTHSVKALDISMNFSV